MVLLFNYMEVKYYGLFMALPFNGLIQRIWCVLHKTRWIFTTLLDYLRRSVSGQFEMKSIVGGTGLNSELPLQ